MTPDQRAAWLADVRAILDAFEAHPGLPAPYIRPDGANFYLIGEFGPAARRNLASAEAALAGSLGVTFTGATEDSSPGDGYYYTLTAATAAGLPVQIRAITSEVAERKVTGQTVTEVVEWVRRPVEPPDAAGQDEGNPGPGGAQ